MSVRHRAANVRPSVEAHNPTTTTSTERVSNNTKAIVCEASKVVDRVADVVVVVVGSVVALVAVLATSTSIVASTAVVVVVATTARGALAVCTHCVAATASSMLLARAGKYCVSSRRMLGCSASASASASASSAASRGMSRWGFEDRNVVLGRVQVLWSQAPENLFDSFSSGALMRIVRPAGQHDVIERKRALERLRQPEAGCDLHPHFFIVPALVRGNGVSPDLIQEYSCSPDIATTAELAVLKNLWSTPPHR